MATIGELMLLWDIRDELKRANDIVEEERVRREWEKWDREVKEKVIERLRNHEEGANLLTLQKQPIYPNMTQDEQADLLENGDLRLVAPTKNLGPISAIWSDENREEAKNPTYLKLREILDKDLAGDDYRIVF